MKKLVENPKPEVGSVALILLGALIIGALLVAANMWRVYHNETLPQERRQFLDL